MQLHMRGTYEVDFLPLMICPWTHKRVKLTIDSMSRTNFPSWITIAYPHIPSIMSWINILPVLILAASAEISADISFFTYCRYDMGKSSGISFAAKKRLIFEISADKSPDIGR